MLSFSSKSERVVQYNRTTPQMYLICCCKCFSKCSNVCLAMDRHTYCVTQRGRLDPLNLFDVEASIPFTVSSYSDLLLMDIERLNCYQNHPRSTHYSDFNFLRFHVDSGEASPSDAYALGCYYADYATTLEGKITDTSSSDLDYMSQESIHTLANKYLRLATTGGFRVAAYVLSRRLLEGNGQPLYPTESIDLVRHCWIQSGYTMSYYDKLSRMTLLGVEMSAILEKMQLSRGFVSTAGEDVVCVGPFAVLAVLAVVGPHLQNTRYTRYYGKDAYPLMFREQALDLHRRCREQDTRLQLRYGRHGTPSSLPQLQGGAVAAGSPRGGDRTSLLYCLGGPRAVAPSKVDGFFATSDQVSDWRLSMLLSQPISVHCIHRNSTTSLPSPEDCTEVCEICLEDAQRRLRAVSVGAYALSLHANDGDSELSAILFPDLNLENSPAPSGPPPRIEKYRAYSLADVNDYLYCLSLELNNLADPVCSHPLFLAMDPNLFWPAIFYYGSILTALQASAAHIDWFSMLRVPVSRASREGVTRMMPGEGTASTSGRWGGGDGWRGGCPIRRLDLADSVLAKKCAFAGCYVLEYPLSGRRFKKCGRCRQKYYCSRNCQRRDWYCNNN